MKDFVFLLELSESGLRTLHSGSIFFSFNKCALDSSQLSICFISFVILGRNWHNNFVIEYTDKNYDYS